MTFDLLLKNGTVHLPAGPVQTSVGVIAGKIAAIGAAGDAGETIDCTGLDILPGVIDTQVHFREPGLVHKEDLESGARAAVLGGVTAVFEMPNTKPNTDSAEAIADKLARAHHRMWCDHAFYVGATNHNAADLAELERMPGTAGVKIFMGASTGDLLVSEDASLAAVLASGHRRVAIHAEDEDRMNARADERVPGDPSSHPVWRDDESALLATKRIVALARAARRRIHVLHITTPAELEFLSAHKDIVTCEVTPQHLTLAGEEAYPRLGTLAQMNPPIRSGAHRDGLWALGRSGRCRHSRFGPCAAHAGGKGQALSRLAQRHARRADAAAADAQPCGGGAHHACPRDRPHQRRAAARVRHRRQGPHRGRL